jgi:hypothetical protein
VKDKTTEVHPVPDKHTKNIPSQKHITSTEDVQMKDPLPQSQPHLMNTEQGWKDHTKAKKQDATKLNDDTNKTKTGRWHFSSILQDSVNGGDVQDHILNTQVTLTFQEILGVSADLQGYETW